MTEAILLVGGKGTRLRPLTVHTPKPMVRAAGVPFLTHQLARARAAGVDHIVLATSYLAEVFEPYFGDGSSMGLHIEYVTEKEPLGTGGAIRNVAARLHSGPDEPVLVFNGDILTGLDIRRLVRTHETSGADVSLHLTKVTDPRAYGLVPTDDTGRVLAFLEKPQTPEEIVTDQINAGAYVFRRSVIDTIPAGRPVSVERETFPGLLSAGAHLQGMVDSTYWLDLGTPAAFVRGSADLVLGRAPSPAVPGRCGDRLVLPTARVAPDAKLTGGTVVGEGAFVAEGARGLRLDHPARCRHRTRRGHHRLPHRHPRPRRRTLRPHRHGHRRRRDHRPRQRTPPRRTGLVRRPNPSRSTPLLIGPVTAARLGAGGFPSACRAVRLGAGPPIQPVRRLRTRPVQADGGSWGAEPPGTWAAQTEPPLTTSRCRREASSAPAEPAYAHSAESTERPDAAARHKAPTASA